MVNRRARLRKLEAQRRKSEPTQISVRIVWDDEADDGAPAEANAGARVIRLTWGDGDDALDQYQHRQDNQHQQRDSGDA